jgi:hypothetical protein
VQGEATESKVALLRIAKADVVKEEARACRGGGLIA